MTAVYFVVSFEINEETIYTIDYLQLVPMCNIESKVTQDVK